MSEAASTENPEVTGMYRKNKQVLLSNSFIFNSRTTLVQVVVSIVLNNTISFQSPHCPTHANTLSENAK